MPGFLANIDAIKGKGVDTVACISVNDAFVMGAWGKASQTDGKILMLADGSGEFSQAMGLTMDLTKNGLGVRSQRYAMIVKDGKIEHAWMYADGMELAMQTGMVPAPGAAPAPSASGSAKAPTAPPPGTATATTAPPHH